MYAASRAPCSRSAPSWPNGPGRLLCAVPARTPAPSSARRCRSVSSLRGADKETVLWDSWRRDDGTWEVLLVYRVAGEPHSASWTYDPPRRLVQAVDDEARSLIGESDDAAPEPSFPFVPRIARLPRDRPLDRSLDRQIERERPLDRALERQIERPAPVAEPEEYVSSASGGERDSLTSLLEAVPSFRGDMVVPEQPEPPALERGGGGGRRAAHRRRFGRGGVRVRGCADAPGGGLTTVTG